VVAICVLLVALLNISSGRDTSGSLLDSLTGKNYSASPLKNKLAVKVAQKNNLATAPLSYASYSTEGEAAASGDGYFSDADFGMYQPEPTLESQIVLAFAGPRIPTSSRSRQGTKTYEVKSGDTASTIAAAFGVSTSTVLSANGLTDMSVLKPGDKLSILPITGASHKVQSGDTLESIAKKYNVDGQKIIAYNELTADGKLKEGQSLVIPDGYLSPAPTQSAGTRLAVTSQTQAAAGVIRLAGGGTGHRFPYGYCTWYVSQRRYVPWGGNAGTWLAGARASGRATGSAPRPGAIVVTTESRWGHVAIVESVRGSSFTISEMNYAGFGRKSTRTLSASSRVVKGFIY